ncbi:MAG: hypothetical protein ACXVPR_05855 [Actinomycetota bacterium]
MLVLRADPWTPDHGMGFETVLDEPPARADPFVETDDWDHAIAPGGADGGPIRFVDGVRRVEQRLIASEDGRRGHALFGTYAAGTVRTDGRAVFGACVVRRALVLGSRLHRDDVRLRSGATELVYRAVTDPGSEPDDPLHRLQKEMQATETELAIEAAADDGELVLADGRWTSQQPTASPVVGVVKRWSRAYLVPEQEALVARLGAGERTPLFGLAKPEEALGRFAWYARLCAVRPEWHDHAGVVRCEVRVGVGLDAARGLADRVTALLPRFAGRTSDPRYPQNLAPVGALETYLQHRMGHRGMIRRALVEWLTTQGERGAPAPRNNEGERGAPAPRMVERG